MSRRIALVVAASALPPHLKQTAVILALHGDDEGDSVFPSLATVARLTSKSPDTVRRDVRALLDSGVLGAGTADRGQQQALFRIGGRGRRNIYRFHLDSLKSFPQGAKVTLEKVCVQSAKGVRTAREKVCVQSAKGVRTARVTSSTCTTQVQETTVRTGAASPPPAGETDAERTTENGAYHRLAAIARHELMSDNPPADEGELHDRLKWHCAQLGFGRWDGNPTRPESSPDLTARVSESEWFKWTRLANLKRKIFAQADACEAE